MRPSDLASKVIQLVKDKLEFKPWFLDFKPRALETTTTTTKKSLYHDSLFLKVGDVSVLYRWGLTVVFHVMVV